MLFKHIFQPNAENEEKEAIYFVPGCLHPDEETHDITDGTFYIDFQGFLPGNGTFFLLYTPICHVFTQFSIQSTTNGAMYYIGVRNFILVINL